MIFEVIFTYLPIVCSVIAAYFSYQAYSIVKLERDIRIAREEAEKDDKDS